MMVGRDLTERFPKKDNETKELILEIKANSLNQPSINDVSFELYKEILGIAGLVGSKNWDSWNYFWNKA